MMLRITCKKTDTPFVEEEVVQVAVELLIDEGGNHVRVADILTDVMLNLWKSEQNEISAKKHAEEVVQEALRRVFWFLQDREQHEKLHNALCFESLSRKSF